MSDDLGNRMKRYEAASTSRYLMPLLPAIARVDGRCFSAFTRDLDRPYDTRLTAAFIVTAEHLARETGAACAYTQSDEITLVWYAPDPKSQLLFDGRCQKLESVLAAMATAVFGYHIARLLPPAYATRLPHFDARAFNVPTCVEAVNCLVWREWDATKNSITMAASAHYSHKELFGKSGAEKQEMLFQKGVNWNDFPAAFKRGTYVLRKKVVRPFTADELDLLPEKHGARLDPTLTVERTEYEIADMPPLTKVVNRVDVIFNGAAPAVAAVDSEAK